MKLSFDLDFGNKAGIMYLTELMQLANLWRNIMVFEVTSRRGHHEAVLDDLEVAEAVFNKMTGKTHEALDPALKVKIPDTWQELQGLWKTGPMEYIPAQKTGEGETIGVKNFKDFQPDAKILFIAPITGG